MSPGGFWGWSPNPVTPVVPPETIVVYPGTDLQPIADRFTTGAGQILLAAGNHYALASSPSTPLTITSAAYGLLIAGYNEDDTIIKSPVLMQTGKLGLQRLRVSPDGTDYGVKIYNGGAFTARCWMREVWVGAVDKNSAIAGNGPKDGLILDGAGVFLAEKVTLAFNRRHGLLADSTGVDPNTTLKFDMCSFVQNGFGPAEVDGRGINLQGSLSIAEFNGGNSEGNKFGELLAQNMNHVRLRDFDFETSETMTEQVLIQTCNPVTIDGCNFLTAVGKATKAVTIQGSNGISIFGNRFAGWGYVGVIRIDETSRNCWIGPNPILAHADAGNGTPWIEDYSI